MDSGAQSLPSAAALWRPVAACGGIVMPLLSKIPWSDPRVLQAWMLGCLDACWLAGLLAGWLAGLLGMEVEGVT